MTGLNDTDLEAQLKRRRASSPLGHVERGELVETIHAQTHQVAPERRWWNWRTVAGTAAAAMVLVLVAAVAIPRLTSTPAASQPAATSPETTPPPTVQLGLHVLTEEELVALAADPTATGRTVVSDADVSFVPSPTQFDVPGASPQAFGTIDARGMSIVVVGQSFPDPNWTNHAFRALDGNRLEYLGGINDSVDTGIWSVPAAIATAPPEVAYVLYAVQGWLMQTVAAPCAAPPDMSAPQNYWCGGSWITAEPISNGDDDGSVQLTIAGGIHVQWDAYREFAQDPSLDIGGEPRLGTYLIRPAGCPPNVMGDCPVWEMVGRIDPASTAIPTQTPEPPAPSPTRTTSGAATSFGFASSPGWDAVEIPGGTIWGYDVQACLFGKQGYELPVADRAELELSDGTLVDNRNAWHSPFWHTLSAPAWLSDESGWARDATLVDSCTSGWLVFVTPSDARPATLYWVGSLNVSSGTLGEPAATPLPTPSPAPDSLDVTPGAPYVTAAMPAWWRTDGLEESVVLTGIANAKAIVRTLTGAAYWDTTVTTWCVLDACELEIHGSLAHAAGIDSWPFTVDSESGVVELDQRPEMWGAVDRPEWSVPASVTHALEQIVAGDADAMQRIAPFAERAPEAAWYPFQPGLMSLTYSRPLAVAAGLPTASVGVEYLTVFIDTNEQMVIGYKTDSQDG